MIKAKKYSTNGDKTKLYADLMMVFSLGASTVIMGLPIPDTSKLWINSIIGFIGLGGKLLTNVVEFKSKNSRVTEEIIEEKHD